MLCWIVLFFEKCVQKGECYLSSLHMYQYLCLLLNVSWVVLTSTFLSFLGICYVSLTQHILTLGDVVLDSCNCDVQWQFVWSLYQANMIFPCCDTKKSSVIWQFLERAICSDRPVVSFVLDLILKHCRMLVEAQLANRNWEIINQTQAVHRFKKSWPECGSLYVV